MTKKFKFRLETLLKVRKIELERQAKVLALIHQRIAQAHMDVNDFRRMQVEEVKRMKELSLKALFSHQLAELSVQYREELKRKEARKIQEIRELMMQAEVEHGKLVENEKKKKILDKLEERDRENYEEELKKSERKEMDETAGSRWFRSD
jgi:flagellar FliJ protein